jgi:cysteine desulfurase
LEKSISNRFYFDFNATSPLAKKVQDFLHNGEFFFGNPASLHSTGKNARSQITKAKNYLFKTFSLSENEFDLYFHSGATEGINNYFKGCALKLFKENKKASFIFSTVDHSAVTNLKADLEILGHKIIFFEVNKEGDFNLNELIELIKTQTSEDREVFLNYTFINNETGVVWPLNNAEEIKNQTKAYVHVDAVQVVGKITNWNFLSSNLDVYTFSAHKFGALKGVGFSFVKKGTFFHPLISGGNQQGGLRSGTENALGIYSIQLALEEIEQKFNGAEALEAQTYLLDSFTRLLGSKGEVVAKNSKHRNLNTFFVIIYNSKAELVSMKLDMNKIDVSTGSACSSGLIKESRVLMNMGYEIENAKSAIRFSFSPYLTKIEAQNYFDIISNVLNSFLI